MRAGNTTSDRIASPSPLLLAPLGRWLLEVTASFGVTRRPTRGTMRRAAAAAIGLPTALVTGQMWWVRHKFKLPPDASGPMEGVCTTSTKRSSRRKNIVFMGDSIVTGVGCSMEASAERGPIMPRRVAQIVAERLGEDVGWKAVGETGADVRMVRSRLLPKLEREAQRVEEDRKGERIDAVVLITGLNDIKECFLFANPRLHPWHFCESLTALLGSICETAGSRCTLLVPGCPINAVPRFNEIWPFSIAVHAIVGLWETQKRRAAEAAQQAACAKGGSCPSITFQEPPPHLVHQMLDGGDYFASDGMHPNDTGYHLWAEVIAQRLLEEFEARAVQAGQRAEPCGERA
jgi:lysophospholipase L1-like esterase